MEGTERLDKLRKLLKIERDEDYAQYKEHFSRNNINHRKQTGVTWYPIVISNEGIGLGEYLSVDIERTTNHNEPHLFSGGKQAALFSNNVPEATPIIGTVKILGPNKLRLSLTIDELPEWCDQGKLGINVLFDEASYREMDLALEKVITASHNRLAHLRDVCFGLKPPAFEKQTPINIPELNASQNQAVQKILEAKDLAIVHGPPGTGKTTTLVQAIKQTLLTDTQVLVCSSSNTAVDVLTEKLFREGLSVLRLGNPARVSPEVLMNTLDAKVAAHPSFRLLKNFRKTAEEYFRMAGKYKRNFNSKEREQRQLMYQEARKILKDARMLEDEITQEQFDKARVICCTPVGSAGRLMRDLHFNTLFMDEAAQALEPMCFIPITKCNRIVLAGDHFQLPPTVKSKKAEAQGLKETLFERCITYPNVSVMLNTQYRMNKNIMQFSNTKFYRGELMAHPTVSDQVLAPNSDYLPLTNPIDFIDTAGCGYTELLNPESLSNSNPEEALLLLNHLKDLLQNYVQHDAPTVGIISPYKEQVQYLTQLIADDPQLQTTEARIAVKTVDGFQGQERDIIYISMVRSNDTGEIGFLSDIRRMNVALTRARKKLVVIGDSATLGNHPFYKDFLNYIESIDAYHSAWEFIKS